MWRPLFTFGFATHTLVASAQAFTPPETGKTIDQSFRVPLSQQVSDECIAWHIKGKDLDVIVALDKAYLKERAESDERGRPEREALVTLAKDRMKGSSGCVEFTYAEVAKYVFVFDAGVVAGKAVVLDGRTNAPAPYAVIRYFADACCGGHVTVGIPGQRPFGGNVWWLR